VFDDEAQAAAGGRPVLLGCAVMAAVLLGLGVVAGVTIAWLQSGADDGNVTLNLPESYARGTVTRIPERGILLSRLPDGRFVALYDLDDANREAAARRCRANVVTPSDPAAPLITKYLLRVSAEAAGEQLVFTETCNGAVYDAAGVRLDSDNRNLDRFAIATDADGRLVVETAKRSCSRREGAQARITVEC
jgi:hypothetical protein